MSPSLPHRAVWRCRQPTCDRPPPPPPPHTVAYRKSFEWEARPLLSVIYRMTLSEELFYAGDMWQELYCTRFMSLSANKCCKHLEERVAVFWKSFSFSFLFFFITLWTDWERSLALPRGSDVTCILLVCSPSFVVRSCVHIFKSPRSLGHVPVGYIAFHVVHVAARMALCVPPAEVNDTRGKSFFFPFHDNLHVSAWWGQHLAPGRH